MKEEINDGNGGDLEQPQHQQMKDINRYPEKSVYTKVE